MGQDSAWLCQTCLLSNRSRRIAQTRNERHTVVQFSSVIYWYLAKKPEGLVWWQISPMAAALAAVILAFGQVGKRGALL